MGLDIYFHKVKNVRNSVDEKVDINELYTRCYEDADAYFRKANFIYHYFNNKLENEMCEVTKSDLDDLISRCDNVLADHTKAEELLPTQEGFFFGSTEYNEWYFQQIEDCRNELARLKKNFNGKRDVVFVVMSW